MEDLQAQSDFRADPCYSGEKKVMNFEDPHRKPQRLIQMEMETHQFSLDQAALQFNSTVGVMRGDTCYFGSMSGINSCSKA